MTIDYGSKDTLLRERAVQRLKKRRDFYRHVLAYVSVNGFLVIIWAMTGAAGFFWPIFPMTGWGVGVIMNAWDVYSDDEMDETHIRQEMQRLQKQ
ncbi:2TM domain-containing protein [Jatrophihabitans sp.]|uniref:2TM domain-containing protein n=1 Tax=Jatrophihabitans sp. TaxID=1932789 RepID=UPI002CF6F956|nr:2TM domain-containing protein [Jatrophihabitans sp.]